MIFSAPKHVCVCVCVCVCVGGGGWGQPSQIFRLGPPCSAAYDKLIWMITVIQVAPTIYQIGSLLLHIEVLHANT